MIFRQFNVRKSFTTEESKNFQIRKQQMIGKRSLEEKEEEGESLITDMAGLVNFEKDHLKQVMSNTELVLDGQTDLKTQFCTDKQKKTHNRQFISDFFESGKKRQHNGKQANLKR